MFCTTQDNPTVIVQSTLPHQYLICTMPNSESHATLVLHCTAWQFSLHSFVSQRANASHMLAEKQDAAQRCIPSITEHTRTFSRAAKVLTQGPNNLTLQVLSTWCLSLPIQRYWYSLFAACDCGVVCSLLQILCICVVL